MDRQWWRRGRRATCTKGQLDNGRDGRQRPGTTEGARETPSMDSNAFVDRKSVGRVVIVMGRATRLAECWRADGEGSMRL